MTDPRAFHGKVAIITGAGSGIGRASAVLFAEHGAQLLLAGPREAPLAELARLLGEAAVYLSVDVTKQHDNERMFAEAQRKFGGCDIFVANAGSEGVSELIENYPMAVFDEVMSVNVRAVFLGLKCAMPIMRARGGLPNVPARSGSNNWMKAQMPASAICRDHRTGRRTRGRSSN